MEARLIALEERLRKTDDVLVSERLARQTAEAAQQAVGPQPQPAGAGVGGGSERLPGLPSLVDTKAIGKPPTFSGDVDVNGQPEGMPWSQWSFVFRSYVGAFDPTATRLLNEVESNVEDQHEHDGGGETSFDTIVLRACFGLQRKGTAGGQTSSRRVRFRGVETAVQRV